LESGLPTAGGLPYGKKKMDRILHPVQGSAVPVFLGTIDIDWIYFYGSFRITHFSILL
jgi:hypothetical protein